MSSGPGPIHIGLIADEPIRLAGLATIFEYGAQGGRPHLAPVTGTLDELLGLTTLGYLVVDLNSGSCGLETLESIRVVRPELRLIVIGPAGDDELVLNSIIAGARAYLSPAASPETIRLAIEVVTEGSIWAPRRLLSKLIDRLLRTPNSGSGSGVPRLTEREQQVLDLILMAQPNREIARQLGIEERTVKAHVSRLMRKTGAENRIELSMRALNRIPRMADEGREAHTSRKSAQVHRGSAADVSLRHPE
jgi:DNA-binding NarL/FixJ family response regulator